VDPFWKFRPVFSITETVFLASPIFYIRNYPARLEQIIVLMVSA